MKEMTLEDIKLCELNILKWFDSFCKDNKLQYWLAYGTLLGAVRHHGFIPWDDDIDVMMPRKDYERLCNMDILSDRYSLLTPYNTPDFPYAMGKVVDTKTIKLEPLRRKFQVIGVDIDVFPVDNYPSDAEESRKLVMSINNEQKRINMLIQPYGRGRNIIRSIARNILFSLYHFVNDIGLMPISKYTHRINEFAQSYNISETGFKGNYILISSALYNRNPDILFSSSIDIQFEDSSFPIPIGWDSILKTCYGDYKQLPPIEKRVTHHSYKAYWKD